MVKILSLLNIIIFTIVTNGTTSQKINFKGESSSYRFNLGEKIYNPMANSKFENGQYSESECGCVPVQRCAYPGIVGPRETANEIFSKIDASKIINNPPPVSPCTDGYTYCCNIIPSNPQPQPLFPILEVSKPEKRSTCGLRRIPEERYPAVAAGQAAYGKYPWIVRIASDDGAFGGSLLDSTTVLTSAHNAAKYAENNDCKSLKVLLGEWDTKRDEPWPVVTGKVQKIILHPDFNRLSLENDIAIIKLEPVLVWEKISNPNINSICLPNKDSNFIGEKCWVAGFGITETGFTSDILREVDVEIQNSDNCESALRRSILGSGFSLNKKSFICGGGSKGKDACVGDGGSPLVCLSDGRWRVVGITSWGIGCGEKDLPGVYTNVKSYVDWISKFL